MTQYYGITVFDGYKTEWSGPCQTKNQALAVAEMAVMDTFGSKSAKCAEYLRNLKVEAKD
jgi:hypothetical protein